VLEFQQQKYVVEQVASLSMVLSNQQERLQNARATLRELNKENNGNSFDDEREEARLMIEFWKDMCKKTKAALQHQSNSIIRMGTAVKPV
jgi:hypothetical protein